MKRHSISMACLIAGLLATSSAVFAQSNPSSTPGASTPSMGSTQPGTQSGTGGTSGTAQTAGTAAPAALLVLMPLQQASDPNMANGCWVRFYTGENFRGQSLTLAGPVNMANMTPTGAAWQNWDSAIVGAKATVTTFDNENFRDRTATLNAGQRIADLDDKKLGWFEEVKSARVSCASS